MCHKILTNCLVLNYTEIVILTNLQKGRESLKNWSKTILECYRYLETIVETIDDMVRKLSVNSVYFNRKSNNDTLSVINKIIDLNDRKVNLTNLKVIVDTVMSKMRKQDAQFLALFYLDRLSIEETAAALDICVRSAFRRKVRAIDSFTAILSQEYSCEYFANNYADEQWLVDLYGYNVSKEKDKVVGVVELDADVINGKNVYRTLKEIRRVAV